MSLHFSREFSHDLSLRIHEALGIRGGDIEGDIRAAHFGIFWQYGFTLLQNGGEFVGHQAIMEARRTRERISRYSAAGNTRNTDRTPIMEQAAEDTAKNIATAALGKITQRTRNRSRDLLTNEHPQNILLDGLHQITELFEGKLARGDHIHQRVLHLGGRAAE